MVRSETAAARPGLSSQHPPTRLLLSDGVAYTNVTGDLRPANYSSLREGKLEFRRRIEQFQDGTLVFQLCRPVWRRWMGEAVLAGALKIPGFAEDPAAYVAIKWSRSGAIPTGSSGS